jgi:hypothetical protein
MGAANSQDSTVGAATHALLRVSGLTKRSNASGIEKADEEFGHCCGRAHHFVRRGIRPGNLGDG